MSWGNPWEKKNGILGGNKLKGKVGNTENYMYFHISRLARLLYITVMLFTFNFASPVNQDLGRYVPAILPVRRLTIKIGVSMCYCMILGP
jgi:hypothetical protein